MIEYTEKDSYRIPATATIVLKLLCDAIHEATPEAKFFVTVLMSTDGIDSYESADFRLDTDTGELECLDKIKLTPNGFSPYKTHVLHKSEDGEDFIIVSFRCMHGEIDEHGNGLFSVERRYYSLRDIQALNESDKLETEASRIVAIAK